MGRRRVEVSLASESFQRKLTKRVQAMERRADQTGKRLRHAKTVRVDSYGQEL